MDNKDIGAKVKRSKGRPPSELECRICNDKNPDNFFENYKTLCKKCKYKEHTVCSKCKDVKRSKTSNDKFIKLFYEELAKEMELNSTEEDKFNSIDEDTINLVIEVLYSKIDRVFEKIL
jgi:hypothetical protein